MTNAESQGLVPIDDKIDYEPASIMDDFGRVFWYEKNVYRGVNKTHEHIAKDIVTHSQHWAKSGLIETNVSNFTLDDYSMVLSHRTVEFRSYRMEWLPDMLRDAALGYLRLQGQLIKDGYILKDSHPWNILFEHGQPVYIDVGSIIPYDASQLKKSFEQFRLAFYLPLVMFSKLDSRVTYDFFKKPSPKSELAYKYVKEMNIPAMRVSRYLGDRFSLKQIARKISKLKFNKIESTNWTRYEQKSPDFSRPDTFNQKQLPVFEVLSRIKKGTLLDIGCNKGWFSLLAESMGFRVVSIDIDLVSLSLLYEQVKRERKNILPLYVDICEPTASHGVDNCYTGFMERMKFDVVIAMAVVHHLAYRRNLRFEVLAERIAGLTRDVAVIESIPNEDFYVSKWDQAGMQWYTRDHFIEVFMRHFKRMTVLPSFPAPREIFVFEKIEK